MTYNFLDLIKADLYRYEGKCTIKSFCHSYMVFEGFRFSVWLRACSVVRQKFITKYTLLPICRMIYLHYKYKYGYDIPYAIEIGPGLQIFHIGGIVFSPKKCGKNLTISHNTTVGMTLKNGKKMYPVIGDNLYLAPGSAIVGGIIIGNNVAVGTNCVVRKDIDDKAVVVGNPANVINHNGSYKYVNNSV